MTDLLSSLPQPVRQPTRLALKGADVRHVPNFLNDHQAFFDALKVKDGTAAPTPDDIAWRHEKINIQGRLIDQPRLTSWYGDAGAGYTYSGLRMEPLAWTSLLLELRRRVEAETGATYNSVLLNYYRHSRDSIGFHADDEKELGPNPTIASISLGATRIFELQPKWDKTAAAVKVPLAAGDLLVMAGATQKNWKHGIRKVDVDCGPRINLTFRKIY